MSAVPARHPVVVKRFAVGNIKEVGMHRQRDFLLFVILATATATLVRTATPAESPASTNPQGAISIPDFSGVWAKPHLGIESLLSRVPAQW
jgi:hypothetical protein